MATKPAFKGNISEGHLVNCPACGKLFTQTSRAICPDCWESQEFEVRLVQQWMKQNPGHTMERIAKLTEVPLDRINEYIRSGRIIVDRNDFKGTAKCAECEAPIVSGKLCRTCLAKIQQELSGPAKPHEKSDRKADSGPMHVDGGGEDSSAIRKVRR